VQQAGRCSRRCYLGASFLLRDDGAGGFDHFVVNDRADSLSGGGSHTLGKPDFAFPAYRNAKVHATGLAQLDFKRGEGRSPQPSSFQSGAGTIKIHDRSLKPREGDELPQSPKEAITQGFLF
jgi:hypothetical protein